MFSRDCHFLVGTLERLKGFIEKLIFFCHSHVLVCFAGINYDKKFSSGRDFLWFMIDFLLRLTSINVTTEEKFLMVIEKLCTLLFGGNSKLMVYVDE